MVRVRVRVRVRIRVRVRVKVRVRISVWKVHFPNHPHDDPMTFIFPPSSASSGETKRAFEGGVEAASPKAFLPPPLFTDLGFRVEVRVKVTVIYRPCS